MMAGSFLNKTQRKPWLIFLSVKEELVGAYLYETNLGTGWLQVSWRLVRTEVSSLVPSQSVVLCHFVSIVVHLSWKVSTHLHKAKQYSILNLPKRHHLFHYISLNLCN